nr:O-antigen ligase family protein [candidate division Zixibacteria bacterium]
MNGRLSAISIRIGTYSLFGYFLGCTFSHALGQNFLALALLSIIVAYFSGEYRKTGNFRNYFWIFVGLFLAWSIISSIVGSTPGRSLFILKEEWLFLMIPAAALLLSDEKKLKTGLVLFAISFLMVSVYAVWQHFSGIDPYHGTTLAKAFDGGFRVTGNFSHRLTFGNFFATGSILCLACAPRLSGRLYQSLFYGAFAVSATAVVFTYNRSSIAALVFGIVMFFFLSGRKYIKTALILLAAIILVVLILTPEIYRRYTDTLQMELEGTHQRSRQSTWRTGIRMFADNPVFGVGPGNYYDNSAKYRDKTSIRLNGHAHNDVINIAAYAGLPTAIFYLGFWVMIIVKMIRLLRKLKEKTFIRAVIIGTLLASLVFFITSFSESTFADEEVRLFLMAIWGIFFAAERVVKGSLKTAESIEKA